LTFAAAGSNLVPSERGSVMDIPLRHDPEELGSAQGRAGAYESASDMAALSLCSLRATATLTLRDAQDETSEPGPVDWCIFGGDQQYVLGAM
jgi:hypothetical protein